jgi:2-keto-4-pentenoate hydratase
VLGEVECALVLHHDVRGVGACSMPDVYGITSSS